MPNLMIRPSLGLRLAYYRQEAAKSGKDWRTIAGDYRSHSPAKISNPDCGERKENYWSAVQ